MASNKGKGDFQIGYGKPPKQTGFKPGQSGNPRGHRVERETLRTSLRGSPSASPSAREAADRRSPNSVQC